MMKINDALMSRANGFSLRDFSLDSAIFEMKWALRGDANLAFLWTVLVVRLARGVN